MISKTLTSIDLSNCGISVVGVTEVAKFISAGAAMKEQPRHAHRQRLSLTFKQKSNHHAL